MKLEQSILEASDKDEANTVMELVNLLTESFSEVEVLKCVRKLEDEGKIELDYRIPSEYTFTHYLKNFNHSLGLHLLLILSLSTLATIYILPPTYPLVVTRWVFGSIFVLYLPGYSLVETFFPRRSDLAGIVRLVLSVGLSFAVTPLIGLLLNYTPWGIRLDPIVASLSLFTLGMAFIASYRKFLVAKKRG